MRRGRPLGEKALAMLTAIQAQPRTLRAVALDLQLSIDDAHNARKTLMSSGLIAYGQKVAGVHDKPARVLQPADADPMFPRVIRLFP